MFEDQKTVNATIVGIGTTVHMPEAPILCIWCAHSREFFHEPTITAAAAVSRATKPTPPKENEKMTHKTTENMGNADESKGAPIGNTGERGFDPLFPARTVEMVDHVVAAIYEMERPGREYVRALITCACEEAFRKALTLSENELAKQLADALQEIKELILMGGGPLDQKEGT
jgi:hypothetical protein